MNPVSFLRTYLLFNPKVFRSILFCSFILIFVLNGYSQDSILIIKNKLSGKERVLIEGKLINVVKKDGNRYHGRLKFNCDSCKVANSSTIILQKDTIELKDIQVLRTQSLVGKIAGVPLAIAGVGAVIFGVITIVTAQPGDWELLIRFAGLIIAGGGAFSTLSGYLLFTSGRFYKSENWEYYIIHKKQ